MNRFDLFLLALAGAFAVPPLQLAWTLSGHREIELRSVEPRRFVVGSDLKLRIHGTGFTPDSEVRLSKVPLGRPAVVTLSYLEVEVPPDLPPGFYHPVVVGPRRSGMTVFPITVVWKPEITSVRTERFQAAEGTLLTVNGKRFQPDSALFLGQTQLTDVQYADDTLLRARVHPMEVPPGPSVLKVMNAEEESVPLDAIQVLGKATVPLALILGCPDIPAGDLPALRRLSTGEDPMVVPAKAGRTSSVQFIRILEERPAEDRDRSYLQLQAGVLGTLEYDGERISLAYQGQPLSPGARVELKMNSVIVSGVLQGAPVVRSERYPPVSQQ